MEVKKLKDKNVAAILALFGGFFGLHRYYLGQIGLGIAYSIFALTFIPAFIAFIDFIVFISQSKLSFDAKYNKEYFYRSFAQGKNNPKTSASCQTTKNTPTRYREIKGANQMFGTENVRPQGGVSRREISTRKAKAIKHFRDFELRESKKVFLEILEYTPRDASIHFNLACIYSLDENAEKAFESLDRAVKYGMEHIDKITSHDALAFLRIQPEFEEFRLNNFKIPEGGFHQTPISNTFEKEKEKISLELKEESKHKIKEERNSDREV